MDLNSPTILIVEDEPETLKGYEEFLRPQQEAPERKSSRSQPKEEDPPADQPNYQLILAQSGEDAIAKVVDHVNQGGRIAAGFFDVKLGSGLDGLSTIQEIRKLDPDIHCVVVTAYHDRSVEEIDSLFGAEFADHWDYLNKPFTRGEIVQKARQMVSAWRKKKELEALQSQLIESERLAAVGQVARGIGHEFGNILIRILGKADLSLEIDDLNKIKENLKVILAASERAGVIVRNLQSFSRVKAETKLATVDQPIEESLSLMAHDFVKANVEVKKKLSSTPKISMDSGGIAQVVLNLLINSTHVLHEKGGGEILIESESSKRDGREGVQITISDNGPGIPKDVLPSIFQYAFTTKGAKGSGLGLAVSREIVESHSGIIEASSKQNTGAQFLVWLPQEVEE